MARSSPFRRSSEDIPDLEVRQLRRLAFSAALAVRDWQKGRGTRLDFIEQFVATRGVVDNAALRFTVAQAAQFLAEPAIFSDYVPPLGAQDEEWLRFMIEERHASDADLAFQIARARGESGLPAIAQIKRAREKLGLGANSNDLEDDTLAILSRMEGKASARDFLTDIAWLTKRVKMKKSDGMIAKDLVRIGVPCDRSTVRLYRHAAGLKRADRDV